MIVREVNVPDNPCGIYGIEMGYYPEGDYVGMETNKIRYGSLWGGEGI